MNHAFFKYVIVSIVTAGVSVPIFAQGNWHGAKTAHKWEAELRQIARDLDFAI